MCWLMFLIKLTEFLIIISSNISLPFPFPVLLISIMHVLTCLIVFKVSISFVHFSFLFHFIFLKLYKFYWCSFQFTNSLFCQFKSVVALLPSLVNFSLQLLYFSTLEFLFGLSCNLYIFINIPYLWILLSCTYFIIYMVSFISLNIISIFASIKTQLCAPSRTFSIGCF